MAFYVSGQLLTEDYYVFNKLTKGLIGTNNIDTNSRLCMSSAVTGYKATLGADAPPACYEDIDHADCLFIAGSNTAFAHPILYRRIEAARLAHPDLKTIVVDPRLTDTAREADLHLAILPGTDVALYNGMLHVMLWEGLCDTAYIAAHTDGFEQIKATVRDYTPQMVAETCGIAPDAIVQGGQVVLQRAPTLSMYCQRTQPVDDNGTQNNAALINLHLASGQIGRPGAGPFSLTGQPNAWADAKSAAWPTCCRRIATWPILRIAPKSRRCGAFPTCPPRREEPRWSCSKPWHKARSRQCGSHARIRRNPCRIWAACTRHCAPPSWWWCRTPSTIPTQRRSPTSCFLPPRGRKRKARSPIPSVASRA